MVILPRRALEISKSIRASNARQIRFRNFELSSKHIALLSTAGNRALQYPLHVPPLYTSSILPWLIIRPCPTLGSAVAHGSENFVGGVHSRRYSSRVRARIAVLLAVRRGHKAVVVVVQQQCARSWDTMQDNELVGCLFLFESAYFLQRNFLMQYWAVDIDRRFRAPRDLCGRVVGLI